MRLKDSTSAIVKNLRSFTHHMSSKVKVEKLSRLKNFGKQLLILKSKLELHIYCIKIMLMLNLTISI